MNTRIKFWSMANSGFASKKNIDQEIRAFQKLYPKIEVETEILSWSKSWHKIINAVKEKNGPDIVQIGTTWIGTLAYLKAIRKLDDKKINLNAFLPSFLQICSCFGHMWAVPWFCEGRVMFYRKDYLRRTGSDISAFATWESFKNVCIKVLELYDDGPKIAPFAFPGQKEQSVLHDIASIIWSYGGEFISKDGNHSRLDSESARNGFRYFLELISSKCVSKMSFEQNTDEVARNFFVNDAFAFMISTSWPTQVYLNPEAKHYIGRNKASNFGIALIPKGPAGRFNFAGGSALAVTEFTKNPEAAFTLVDFLSSRQSMSRYCRNIKMLSARNDVKVNLTKSHVNQKTFETSVNESGKSFGAHPLWGSIEQITVDGISESLKSLRDSEYESDLFFMHDISQEIEYMLSIFGEK